MYDVGCMNYELMLRKEEKKYCAESCSLTGNRLCVGTLPQAYGLLAARPVREGILVEKSETYNQLHPCRRYGIWVKKQYFVPGWTIYW
jgi:hypothetical protein